jgi:internalin A
MMAALEIFFSYAHKDEVWLKRIETSLMGLVRRDLIHVWHDGNISQGTEWLAEMKERLEMSQIIVLLVSPDFIASDFCWNVEMPRVIERHQEGSARVIPIIVRPANWKKTLLQDFQALPRNGKALSTWKDKDSALQEVAEDIERIVERLSIL